MLVPYIFFSYIAAAYLSACGKTRKEVCAYEKMRAYKKGALS